MGGYGDVQMIDENGLRVDGRGPGDLREISIQTGVVPVADGSCRMTWGTNEAIVAVYGPMECHPRKLQRQDRAVLDVAYNMAPFSTTDRMRPGFNRRSREVSKVTKTPLRAWSFSSCTHDLRLESASRSFAPKPEPVASDSRQPRWR